MKHKQRGGFIVSPERITVLENEIEELFERIERIEKLIKEDKEEQLRKLEASQTNSLYTLKIMQENQNFLIGSENGE